MTIGVAPQLSRSGPRITKRPVEEEEVSNRTVKSTAHHSFRYVVSTFHDPGFHPREREFDRWNPQEEKVDFISCLLDSANQTQVAPAGKSCFKAEALAAF